MFGNIHTHRQHLSANLTYSDVWLVIWDVGNSPFISQVQVSPDRQFSNSRDQNYCDVIRSIYAWQILATEWTVVHVMMSTVKLCLDVLEGVAIQLRSNIISLISKV